ncbi:unnamed protein product [Macrosiphum euphorbiae]|uniref:Uncharacterized protein n=1 Tax=Macrosiphum euphorbiae TaxID=13131 RepID=A0AAV0X1Y0_9HEMI|nr:unnamed protein product [Macrosiphum euphorbiae]
MASSIDCFLNLDFNGSSLFINHYKDVMNVSVDMLKAEMMVFKNCLPTNFSFDDVKKNIQKVTYPNLYKLIQQRFSNLSILNIERDITNNLKSEQILNKFNLHSRKIMLK